MNVTKQQISNMAKLMDEAYNGWTDQMSQEDFWLQLDFLPKVAVFIGNLNYQVENGGFQQWHDNEYDACAHDLLKILEMVGGDCLPVAKLVEQAIVIFEEQEDSRDYDDYGDDYGDDYYGADALNALDGEFYSLNDKMLLAVEAFITAKESKNAAA